MASAAPPRPLSLRRRLGLTLVVWLAMLGLDFVLNGALFAPLYQGESTFILAPGEAFRRIPLGYLAFLILAAGIVELVHRLRVSRVAEGVRLGLLIGAVLAATWSLGLYSIASLSAQVALALAGIWMALAVAAAGVAAAGNGRQSMRRLALQVGAFDVVCVAIVIALQSSGVVPTLKV